MTSALFFLKQDEATAFTKRSSNDVTGATTLSDPCPLSRKLAGMSVDPDDLSPSDGESIGDDGTQATSRSSSPNTSTHATHGSEEVIDDGQQESSKGSASSESQEVSPSKYEGRGLRRNNRDFTATFDFIREATRQRKARLSKGVEADIQASVVNASREKLSDYYGWRPGVPRRAMPLSNFFQKDRGCEMIAASDGSEHESDKEVEDECEGSGDADFRRGKASSTRGESSR